MVSALLGVGALSGCEKNDNAASDAPSEATQDAAQDDTEADAEPEDTEPQDADDTPEPVDDVDTEDPDPADSQDDPADAAVEFLPTTLCPVDVPAPPIPHHMDSEEEGDGAEIYCIAYVSSKRSEERRVGKECRARPAREGTKEKRADGPGAESGAGRREN